MLFQHFESTNHGVEISAKTLSSSAEKARKENFEQDLRRGLSSIKVHPRDDLTGFPPHMLVEPKQFRPVLDHEGEPLLAGLGIHTKWGTFADVDHTAFILRNLTAR